MDSATQYETIESFVRDLSGKVGSLEAEIAGTINLVDRVADLETDARKAVNLMREMPQRAEMSLLTKIVDDWSQRATQEMAAARHDINDLKNSVL